MAATPTASQAAENRPNVLLIVTDDQRAQGTLQVMPHTRRWFEEGGRRYPSAYATTPLCCPSRSSMFTGRYAHNHGVFTNFDPSPLDQGSTVQRHLQEAGYRTGLVGKYLNRWPLSRPPPFFDDWALFQGGYWNTRWNVQGRRRIVRSYSTDFVGNRTTGFIRGAEKRDDEPWFLYVAPYAPHGPLDVAPEYKDAPVGSFPSTPAIEEEDLGDKPPFIGRLRTLMEEAGALNHEYRRDVRRGQLRMLMSVDRMVARIHRTLAETGERENTLALFVSDNGLLWGEHGGLVLKDLPYADSAQIPMMMSWPGKVPAGSVDPRLVANIDLAPTILEAAGGVQPDGPLDGKSLLDGSWARDRLLLEYGGLVRDGEELVPAWASTLTHRRQYTEYYDRDGGNVAFRELSDLRADPGQLENPLADGVLAGGPPIQGLAAQLARDRRCAGSSCP